MNYKILIVLALTACGSQGAIEETGVSRKAVVDDDENCGAEGYACVDGRTCIDSICSPAWITMETMGAPDARGAASAAFIDGKYVLMGGCETTSTDPALDTVVSYDISNDIWGSYPSLNQARAQSVSVSTEAGIFVYGGLTTCFNGTAVGPGLEVSYGSDYAWSKITSDGEPSLRYDTSLSWTGDGLAVFGGSDASNATLSTGAILKLGGPWKSIDCDLADCSYGGSFYSFYESNVVHVLGDSLPNGQIYNLETRIWYDWVLPSGTPDFTTLSDGFPPSIGDDGQRIFQLANDGSVYIYDKTTRTWTNDTSSQPSGLCSEAAATWTGNELIAWGGYCSGILSSVGGRYQPPAPELP